MKGVEYMQLKFFGLECVNVMLGRRIKWRRKVKMREGGA